MNGRDLALADSRPPAVADEPIIPAIDRHGRLYPIGKLKAHQDGVLHLAISVFVFCGTQMLIQQRAHTKYHCGGQWANSCCTHPHWGESLKASANRRLLEELGLELDLRPAQILDYRADVSNNLIEHERVQVFRADVTQTELAFQLNKNEVASVAWVAIEDVRRDVCDRPELYAPWFRIYLARWNELGL